MPHLLAGAGVVGALANVLSLKLESFDRPHFVRWLNKTGGTPEYLVKNSRVHTLGFQLQGRFSLGGKEGGAAIKKLAGETGLPVMFIHSRGD